MKKIKHVSVFAAGRRILGHAPLIAAVMCGCQLAAGAVAIETNAAIRIVARNDFNVNPALKPPEISGRPFWLMLEGGRLRCSSDTNPPPARNELAQFAVATEPMVRDAAVYYYGIDLFSSTNPLTVDGARLFDLENITTNTPFILSVKGAKSQNYLGDFKTINHKMYRQWKAKHSNFLGFYAENEIDGVYCGFLQCATTQHVARLKKSGASEKAIDRTLEIAADAVKGRDQVVEGFRQLFYEGAPRFFFDDPDKMIYLHSVMCVDHYLLEWGTALSILETTNQGPYRHQQGMASARGAARQYGKPWEWYMALCYHGCQENGEGDIGAAFPYYLTTNQNPVVASGHIRGPTCGLSPSLMRRDFFMGYLSGASIVQPETYPYAFWKYKDNKYGQYELSPHGKAMKAMYDFSQKFPDRGVSYAPVALLLPFNHAQSCYGGASFRYFPMTRADTMIDAFQFTIVPHSHDTRKGKEGCLSNNEFGDIYDVIRPDPPSGPVPLAVLKNYSVAVLLGGFDLDKAVAKRLQQYVREGGTLIVNTRQLNNNFPEDFIGAERTGKVGGIEGKVQTADGRATVTLSEPYDYDQIELRGARPLWIDQAGGIIASLNDYGRGRVVLTTVDFMVPRQALNSQSGNAEHILSSLAEGKDLPLIKLLMRQITDEVLPVEVRGDIQYGLNKVADGWWVYLINNKGVTKFTRTAEKLDPAATAKVTIALRDLKVTGGSELLTDKAPAWDKTQKLVTIDVGPGDIRIVKLTVAP